MSTKAQKSRPPAKRVVVTGMGVISTLGETIDDLWANLLAGKSGIGPMTLIPPEKRTCLIAGECLGFVPEAYMDKKESRRMDRYTQFGVAAAKLCFDHSGLNRDAIDPYRFGVVVSSAAGGIGTIEDQLDNSLRRGFNKCSPFLVPMMIADNASGRISIEYKAKGPNFSVVTACATGADSIGNAFRMIANDELDLAFAGGAEAPITPLSVAGFTTCRAMSSNYADPTKASRPFDIARDGFVMGEGAAIVMLESLDHAQARGATIYGEVLGYGRSSDAYDIVAPCTNGDGATRAMTMALKDADLPPEAIHYINMHGTSTPQGDIAETMAIKRVFADYAKAGLQISSTKSMLGHMLGAAGSIEAIISLLAIRDNIIPPTINLDNQDPACDLDYTPHVARKRDAVEIAMSNSFGFGGHNASLVLGQFVE
jgi:3-oxoacyl-[acyl-carrier-protein] synthase II